MSSIVRAVIFNSRDACANYDPIENVIKGHCIDLWDQVVKDLGLEANLTMMRWTEMFAAFKRGDADVIVSSIEHGDLEGENVSSNE